MTNTDFAGKVAFITGGSRGLGREIGLMLAARGARVAFTYVNNEAAAQETAAAIGAAGGESAIFKADVTNDAEVAAAIAGAGERWGRLDFLISNAISFPADIVAKVQQNRTGRQVNMPLEFFDHAHNVQARALLLCAQLARPLMLQNGGGRIVAISSIGSIRVWQRYTVPGVAKAEMEALVKYLAVDLAADGILVNAVSGGAVDTDALNYLTRDKAKLLAETAARTPLKREGTVGDLASVVAFLCSDDARWITGQTLVADGGYSLVN